MRRTITLVIFFSAFIFNVHAESVTCQQRHCLAVVDAGSSGSRVHIYAYDLDSRNNPMKIDELWSKKIKPGLATIEPNQKTMNTYLSNLFVNAPETNMPVYFYATAGMRVLPQAKQQQYYNLLQQWFASQLQWQLIESKTITGIEEGVFGWLAVSYQLGALNSTDNPLVGVMDMGGASVQVTFPVQNADQIDEHDLVTINAYGKKWSLFVHSFLGLGQETFSHQFLETESCFAVGYRLPSGKLGNGDALICRDTVSKLIINVHEVNRIVQPAIANNPIKTWYAMGGVASMAAEKPFSFDNKQFTNQGLLQQANSEVCHQQWQNLDAQYPDNGYLYGFCLFPSYYYALMVEGYGIQPEEPINYVSSGQGADWSLGVVLHPH